VKQENRRRSVILVGVWVAVIFTVGMLLMSGVLSLIFDPDDESKDNGLTAALHFAPVATRAL